MNRLLLLLSVLATSCATLADVGRGDQDLPSALSGPFRQLRHGRQCVEDPDTHEQFCNGVDELPEGTSNGQAKYPGRPPSRSPTALVRGDLHVILFVARGKEGEPTDRIARMESKDARKFDDLVDVIPLDRPDEGKQIGDPFALDVDGKVVLYYSSPTGGIFRARAPDAAGTTFAKDGPITLDGVKDSVETDPPRAPSVLRMPDGTFRLFYASGALIFEAQGDGLRFSRLGPVMTLSPTVDPTTLPEGVRPPFDDAAVDDPYVDRVVTAAGHVLYRMHYTGRDVRGGSSIGFGGRFGDSGLFTKEKGFVYGGKLPGGFTANAHANAPAVARFPGGFALLYANQDTGEPSQRIGVAIAPQSMYLPWNGP